MTVRDERQSDATSIRRVVERAFGQVAEANLVERLRLAGAASISLVAVEDSDGARAERDEVIGHILFSPVTIEERMPTVPALGLAPMAVAPEHQRRGIGRALIETGLTRCRDQGVGLVVVLGHPGYYPRFGFRSAHSVGLTCEYDSSPEAFMALELTLGALDACTGLVRYHPAFADL
jgi:putative acetyltransferase